MCGLAGIISNGFPIHQEQMKEISARVCFRGPDNSGIRVYDEAFRPSEKGTTAIFFNRLAILDLDARSNQPFEDERYTLVFNGEIYNYQELKKRLQQEGCVFHTTSDTEVLFYALQRWGIGAVPKLDGMFAFFWLDRRERKFILARDRMGIKPLYYRQKGKTLIFSSELDSILRLSSDRTALNQAAVDMYLWMQFIPSPYSIVSDAFKLPPGHYIEGCIGRGDTLQPRPFWDAYEAIQQSPLKSDPADAESVLVNSLSHQLVADVPLGLFLSSGVDSSLLAALVNKHFAKEQTFNFFTVAFTESTNSDESREALDYIRAFNNPRLVSRTLEIDPDFIGQHLDNLYNYIDEPFGDPTTILNWVISIKAKEHVTVALSGDGADELFWGYNRYRQWKEQVLPLPGGFGLKGNMARMAGSLMPFRDYGSLAALVTEPDPVKRHFNLFLTPSLTHLQRNPVWKQSIWAMQNNSLIRNREDLGAILDLKTYLADAMLYKVDRGSMAASLEVRVPYLDNVVVDYAINLDFMHKSNTHLRHKAVLKQLLQDLAPHYDIHKPKKGFNFPLDKWLRFVWKAKTLALVNKENIEELGLDSSIYYPLVKEYYKGRKSNAIATWYLLNLVLWNQKFKQISPLQQV